MSKVVLKTGSYLITQGTRIVEVIDETKATSVAEAITYFLQKFPAAGPMGDYLIWAQIDIGESETEG